MAAAPVQVFSYRAVDREAVTKTGAIEASSLSEAVRAVEAMDLELLGIEATSEAGDGVDGNRPPRSEPLTPMPPAAPRPMPPNVTGAAGGVVFIMVGGLFTFVASIFIVVGLVIVASGDLGGWFMVLFPMLHFTIGVGLLVYAFRSRHMRRHLAVNGVPAVATVEEVELDRSVKVNGRSPHKMEYEFEVLGTTYRGKRSTMNRAVTAHIPDDAIWVVYDPEDPSDNMEWPPL